jgi:hypothetical protein
MPTRPSRPSRLRCVTAAGNGVAPRRRIAIAGLVGATMLLAVWTDQAHAQAASFSGSSADGSKAFFTTQESLVAADTDGGLSDVYQRSAGTTTLVSAPGTGASGSQQSATFRGSSADGTMVFFETGENLVAADIDSLKDVYQRSGGTTTLVSAPGAGAGGSPQAALFEGSSSDGTKVFFETNETLVAADTDGQSDVYERSSGATTLVSAPGAGASGLPQAALFEGSSSDGTKVFFDTSENLVTADTDGQTDVYERSSGATTLVSAPGAGASGSSAGASFQGSSSDGTKVFFETSENLVTADTDGQTDVYERSSGATTLVSAPGAGASGSSGGASFQGSSSDGTKVFFMTGENLVAADTDGQTDVYERSSGATTLVSAPGAGASGSSGPASFQGSSSDGTKVFFTTGEKLVAADTDSLIDTYERSGGATTLVSAPGAGASGPPQAALFEGSSSDGTKVFFDTSENLVTADTDGLDDIYERSGGATTLVSAPGTGANGSPQFATFRGSSSDGTKVFFTTDENLVTADTDGLTDVYQRSGGTTTTLVSVEAGPPNGIPPETMITAGPSGPTNDSTPTFEFSSSEQGSTFECQVDNNFFGVCTSPETVALALPDGPHTFRVKAHDPVGNIDPTPAERSFTVDTLPPDTTITAGPSGPTSDSTPTFEFSSSEDGSIFECQVDDNSFGACTSPETVALALPDGPHTFRVKAHDAAGNIDPTAAERSFTVDTLPPDTTITAGPSGPTNDSTPTFEFSSSEQGSSLACRVDGGAFAACTSPVTLGALSAGAHSFEVRSTDAVGNVDASPALRGFTVDTSVVVELSARSAQSIKKGKVVASARCPQESCRVLAKATVEVPAVRAAKRFRLASIRRLLTAGATSKLTFKLGRKALRAVRHALSSSRTRGKVRVKITITATDAAGNSATKTVRVKLKP